MSNVYSEITDDAEREIVAAIVRDLDDEDILAIPGVNDFILRHYGDQIAERWSTRCEDAACEAAEARWRT
jgi:hypothetical protein